MPRDTLDPLRARIDDATYADETHTVAHLRHTAQLSPDDRAAITDHAAQLVTDIRNDARPGMMEVFLSEYGLSTEEGIALMCLAEALLRVPDAATIDALIEDKIAPSNWAKHLGESTSPLVNASTWALMLTGKVLQDDTPGPVGHLRGAIKRLGEPVIRAAVSRAMQEMGAQFVLGESIVSALKRAIGMESKGYTYSYDMLGEAARTETDARRYHLAYSRAISAIAEAAASDDIRENPGISVKLSALHPRYEEMQHDTVMAEVVPRLRTLAQLARSAGIGLNVDAEESDRLSISLDVIEAVLSEPSLKGWNGFGVVVQAYGQRAGCVIDWLYDLANRLDRKIMVRLVKGAYWDTEIKRAQVAGLPGFPVFTTKQHTDISYIANARKLLAMTDRIYPQFATHNAHTVAAILHMGSDRSSFEFQRLHGMGEALHDIVKAAHGTRCRIYAPVGAHQDLLAYLVRRLLENGANSSFVNQIVDTEVPAQDVAADPFAVTTSNILQTGPQLFEPERMNSHGWDLTHRSTRETLNFARNRFASSQWSARPLLNAKVDLAEESEVKNPARPGETVGHVIWANKESVERACDAAHPWNDRPDVRTKVLNRAADLYEAHHAELFALLAREAGKTLLDAVAELREAVDFLRYYAARADGPPPVGTFACISPWNFPLAIFTGQIAAALATGNAVLAKPAEQTPLIAFRAVELLHEAGVPPAALQLLPGAGDVGAALTANPKVGGVAFTGSTETAQRIHRNIADHLDPGTPFIAETGGLNAMIVDSTALPEQAVQAIVESAFQSAGQRCSALRCLYVQDDIAESFLTMLKGAMDALVIGDPWSYSTDVGPAIDAEARDTIASYIETAETAGRVLHRIPLPGGGTFVPPTLLKVSSIAEMEREIFGPVLHFATFKSHDIDKVIDDINVTGYGLTFGLQTRIDDRVQHVSERIEAGNVYVNRNQIGAIVGSQPFGGEGLSGTGPKAGGPHYLDRFRSVMVEPATVPWPNADKTERLSKAFAQATAKPQIKSISLPGPTGESNVITTLARGPVLCLGPGEEIARAQKKMIEELGGIAIAAEGSIEPHALIGLPIHGVLWWGDAHTARNLRKTLATRDGPILPLITRHPDKGHACGERHVCVDTTASGGNAQLLGGMA